MARGGGRQEAAAAAATTVTAAARGRRPRGRGPLGLLCLALVCGLGAAEAEFSILDEAQVLATQMRKLATEELGVVTMQNRLCADQNDTETGRCPWVYARRML